MVVAPPSPICASQKILRGEVGRSTYLIARPENPFRKQPPTLPPLPTTLPTAIGAHQSGNLPRAESLYLDLIESAPSHPDPKNLLGVLYRQQSRFAEAIPLIQQVIALAPQTPDYHFNLAEALRATQQFEAALASYETTLKLRPNDAEAQQALALTLQSLGRSNDALAAAQLAFQHNPQSIENGKGVIHNYRKCIRG